VQVKSATSGNGLLKIELVRRPFKRAGAVATRRRRAYGHSR
jgi:hypothetical protein